MFLMEMGFLCPVNVSSSCPVHFTCHHRYRSSVIASCPLHHMEAEHKDIYSEISTENRRSHFVMLKQ
jgi:hypothetical protein